MALIKNLTNAIEQPDIDQAKILDVSVDPINKNMRVHIGLGYDDNGDFMVKSASVYSIAGQDYDDLMTAMGNPGMAVGEMLQEAIWAKLEALALIDVQ